MGLNNLILNGTRRKPAKVIPVKREQYSARPLHRPGYPVQNDGNSTAQNLYRLRPVHSPVLKSRP